MIADIAGAPLYVVHVSAKQAVEQIAAARDRGAERVRRDLPAVPLPVARGAARAASRAVGRTRGRQVGVLDAAALPPRGPPAPPMAEPANQRHADGLDRPLSLLHEGAEGDGARRLLEDPQRHRLDRAPAWI